MRWQRTSDLSERTLQPGATQGPDGADGNPVLLLRHPHSKCGAAAGQDRADSTAGGLLKRKHAHRNVLSRGELRLCHGEWTKNPAETTGMRYKNVNLMSRMQKIEETSRMLRSNRKH